MKKYAIYSILYFSTVTNSILPALTAADQALFTAINNENLDKIKEAFAQGATTNAKDEKTGRTPLFTALQVSPGWIKDHLDSYSATAFEILKHVDTVTPDEFSWAVSMASGNGDALLPLVQAMRAKITDINAKNKFGETALMFAASSYNPNMSLLQYLLEQGADPNATDKRGWSILANSLRGPHRKTTTAHFLMEHGAQVTPEALVMAAQTTDLDLIKKMVGILGTVNVAAPLSGRTVLTAAIQAAMRPDTNETPTTTIVRYLLDQGADVNAKREGDIDSLLFQVIDNYYVPFFGNDFPAYLELVELLLQHGATVDERTQALIDGNYDEVIRLTQLQSPQQAELEKTFPRPKPDTAKKEAVLQLLEKYKKEKK